MYGLHMILKSYTAIISVNNIKQLILVMNKRYVLFAIGTEF